MLSRSIVVGWIGIRVSAVNCAMKTYRDRLFEFQIVAIRMQSIGKMKGLKHVTDKQKSSLTTRKRIPK